MDLFRKKEMMPEHNCKVFVNARFDVVWEKFLDKIYHPEKYLEEIRHVKIFEDNKNYV
jgi:hypothetical protein